MTSGIFQLGDFASAEDDKRQQALAAELQTEACLKEMQLEPLREEYFNEKPSCEYADGHYAEVYAAEHFIRNFGPSRAAVMQGIRTLQSSGSQHERAMGYSYEAYFYTQSGRWLQGAELYIRAAAERQGHAFYYGYAARAIAKQLRLPGVRQDKSLWTKAAVLMQRAIRLDDCNARWHYYQALNLSHLAPFLAAGGQQELAEYLLTEADAEMSLAEKYLREDQTDLRRHVEREKAKLKKLAV